MKIESDKSCSLTKAYQETKIDDLTMKVINKGEYSVTLRITQDIKNKSSTPYNVRVNFMPDIT